MDTEISVIIAAYDEETCIASCLESLCNQTHSSYEIIVIDDGSKDRTAQIAGEYPVTLFREKHRGPALSRNLGAQRSKGRILIFLDADMIFDPDFLDKLIRPILEESAVGSFTKEEYVANTESRWADFWRLNDGLPPKCRMFPSSSDEGPVFRAILRDEFFRVGGYDSGGYGDDHSLSHKLDQTAKAATGAVCYHRNPESLGDVFQSAKWRGKWVARNDPASRNRSATLSRYALPNSIRAGIHKSREINNYGYLVFKIVYDLGFSVGAIRGLVSARNHAK